MKRPLGSLVLAALLHGVPRALEDRTFGTRPSVYVDVKPADPELADFATELQKAIDESRYDLAGSPSSATLVVELLGVSQSNEGGGMEAARFALREGDETRPVIVHYQPGERTRAAHRLLEALPDLDDRNDHTV